MPDAPQEILYLVATFKRNARAYTSSAYNEAQARSEFIDRLFIALGWDVYNAQGAAPQNREVVTEAVLGGKEGSRTPDYTFRVGRTPIFFVEAKKPQLDLSTNTDTAFQIRSYAWNASLKASILTDFHEFAVYDCQVKPKAGANAAVARVLYLTYEQYADQWNKLYDTFSRQAVWNGSFDSWAAANTGKQGTQTVDAAFLADMSAWRELLAHNLALRNPSLLDDDLNYAVQMTLDRIVFWRICEDRGIEPLDQLRNAAQGREVYQRVLELFRRADQRYNSGLFHFASEKNREAPDTLTPALRVDDAALKQIIDKLYWPAPYNFSQMPVEILGRVYEQFLGSVIRLTPSHQAKVEPKPEVRKAGGVYYTPQYIVRYIVEHTVGELVRDKPPADIADLTVCDPACGSGSFLLGAYEYLLTWYRDWYTGHRGQRARKEIYEGRGGEWLLTVEEKKRILLRHIYGVDIDPQAVEVTKLSLLLKVLEGESEGSMQLKLLQERALPDLGNNIKCGNSLIGWDYPGAANLSPAELKRINPFDWRAAFPQVFARGGFDAVIGNPPYVRVHRLDADIKQYLWTHYSVFIAKSDIYACFVQQGIELLAISGRMSFITPNTWTSLESFSVLREFVLTSTQLEQLVRTPNKVFSNATVCTFVFVLSRQVENGISSGKLVSIRAIDEKGTCSDDHQIMQSSMYDSHLHNLMLEASLDVDTIKERVTRTSRQVGEVLVFFYGFKTADDERFLHDVEMDEYDKAYVRSASVSRYYSLKQDGYVCYRPDQMRAHRITARPGDKQRFERPKIVVARMGHKLMSTLDLTGIYVKDAMLLLSKTDDVSELLFVCGILNSRLLQYFYETYFITIDVLKNALLSLPLLIPADVARHDQMVQLVERMLQLHKDLAAAATPHARDLLSRQLTATDAAIDRLVYELYDLTPEEIALVEAGA